MGPDITCRNPSREKEQAYFDHRHLNATPNVKLSCNCYFGPLHVLGLPKWKQEGVFHY